MGIIYAVHRRHAAEFLRPFGITLLQLDLIRLARQRGSVTPSFAASELACDRPTLTLISRKCLKNGWLYTRPSEGDRRSFRLCLTGEGEDLIDRIDAARVAASSSTREEGEHRDALDVLGAEERLALRSMLSRILERAEELYKGD